MNAIHTPQAPTADQVKYMNGLLDRIERYDPSRAELLRCDYRKAYVTRVLTKQRAHHEIDWLKEIADELTDERLPLDGVKQNFDGAVPPVPSGG